jgi:hypothetical protein
MPVDRPRDDFGSLHGASGRRTLRAKSHDPRSAHRLRGGLANGPIPVDCGNRSAEGRASAPGVGSPRLPASRNQRSGMRDLPGSQGFPGQRRTLIPAAPHIRIAFAIRACFSSADETHQPDRPRCVRRSRGRVPKRGATVAATPSAVLSAAASAAPSHASSTCAGSRAHSRADHDRRSDCHGFGDADIDSRCDEERRWHLFRHDAG